MESQYICEDVETESVTFEPDEVRLISLWKIMEKFDVADCCGLFGLLGNIAQTALMVSSPSRAQELINAYEDDHDSAQRLVPDAQMERFKATLQKEGLECTRSASLNQSAKMIHRLLKNWDGPVRASELEHGIYHLATLMQSEMEERMFLAMSAKEAEIFNDNLPMGESVNMAFPSAAIDIREAAKCLALGRNVAASFHMMRTAEVALWELGRDRQIPFAQAEKIEFKEWGEIIGQLEDSVKLIQQWPGSRVKEDAHKFYNSALVEIRAFNDGWRRHAAHARPYQPPMQDDEGLALWGHTKRFMQTLAGKIGEGRYTELIWQQS